MSINRSENSNSEFVHDMFMPTPDEQDSRQLDNLYNGYCDALYHFARHGLKNGNVCECSNVDIQREDKTCFKQAAFLAVSHLPLRNSEIVELVCFHGYSVGEAAMIVDCAVSVAEMRLSYARNIINAAFQNEF